MRRDVLFCQWRLGVKTNLAPSSAAGDQNIRAAEGNATADARQLQRSGGIFSIDIAVADGPDAPNLGCFLDVIPMERLVFTSMLFPGYRPAVFDDIPITAIITMEPVGTGTRYVFTALHQDEADLETNKTSGFYEGTEIAVGLMLELRGAAKRCRLERVVRPRA